MSTPRNQAIDVARGLAVILMIQTHVFDGWVVPAERATAAFRLTRFLGVLPLPTFLVLAGIGTALRVRAGEARGESPGRVRQDLLERGLEVVAAGYAVNFVLGLIDGASRAETFFRIDVLHAIGLSIVVSALTLVSGEHVVSSKRLIRGGLALALAMSLLSVPGTRLAMRVEGPTRWLLAPFVAVPGITKMPLVPLAAWVGVGAAFGALWLDRTRTRAAHTLLGLGACVLAFGGSVATTAVHDALGGTLDRTHPAIVFNVVDLGARAVALVALVFSVMPRAPSPSHASEMLATLGRHSMLAYAVHLPLAYGRVAQAMAMARSKTMASATVGFVLVVMGTWAVVLLRQKVGARRVARSASSVR